MQREGTIHVLRLSAVRELNKMPEQKKKILRQKKILATKDNRENTTKPRGEKTNFMCLRFPFFNDREDD